MSVAGNAGDAGDALGWGRHERTRTRQDEKRFSVTTQSTTTQARWSPFGRNPRQRLQAWSTHALLQSWPWTKSLTPWQRIRCIRCRGTLAPARAFGLRLPPPRGISWMRIGLAGATETREYFFVPQCVGGLERCRLGVNRGWGLLVVEFFICPGV